MYNYNVLGHYCLGPLGVFIFSDIVALIARIELAVLQSLMFWAGVPVVWMLVTLLIIIMYFCYRCCQREVEKSTPCIKWAIGILALLSWQVIRSI